jgi:predicted chitinase
VKVPWADLKRQACAASVPATPPNFQPQKQILSISFQQTDATKGFDFWIDDVTFDIDTKPATDFAHTVTQAVYSEMFKAPAVPYTYQGFTGAVAKYGNMLAGGATPAVNKREAAAFLAHIAHETGSLTTVVEKCSETCGKAIPPGAPPVSCSGMEPTRGCTLSPYYGRGALQLTGGGNYMAAQGAGFAGIYPIGAGTERITSDVDYAFGTAVWFWMNPQSAVGVCHTAITGGNFGQTTRIINGIECGGTLQDSRVLLYKQFCAALGINPGGNLRC